MELLLWIFTAYGFTSILVWGSIFESTRNWIKRNSKFFGELISCTLCTSTWVGFFMSLVIGGLTINYTSNIEYPIIVWVFFDGMFTAGSVWALNAIIEFFEESRIK